MTRLILSCLWCFATGLFLLSLTVVATNRYLPAEWEEWFPQQVLAETTTSLNDASESAETTNQSPTSVLAETADARAQLVANFIERNDRNQTSPLQPYDEWGRKFVAVADEFGLDFRLLPAIARKESTFCKSNIALTYFNCFGYGVPASGITEAGKFSSYEEGFRTVAASLKRNYLDRGLTDPEAIMRKYCPPSDGTWANDLNQWLAEMRFDEKGVSPEEIINTDLTELVASTSASN